MPDPYKFVGVKSSFESVSALVVGYDSDDQPKTLVLGGNSVELTQEEVKAIDTDKYIIEKVTKTEAKKEEEISPDDGLDNPGAVEVGPNPVPTNITGAANRKGDA